MMKLLYRAWTLAWERGDMFLIGFLMGLAQGLCTLIALVALWIARTQL